MLVRSRGQLLQSQFQEPMHSHNHRHPLKHPVLVIQILRRTIANNHPEVCCNIMPDQAVPGDLDGNETSGKYQEASMHLHLRAANKRGRFCWCYVLFCLRNAR